MRVDLPSHPYLVWLEAAFVVEGPRPVVVDVDVKGEFAIPPLAGLLMGPVQELGREARASMRLTDEKVANHQPVRPLEDGWRLVDVGRDEAREGPFARSKVRFRRFAVRGWLDGDPGRVRRLPKDLESLRHLPLDDVEAGREGWTDAGLGELLAVG